MSFEQRPNLFKWATSELSQDAFLAWLASWAEPACKQIDHDLHLCAKQFVCSFVNQDTPIEIHTIEVKRQWKNIDVLIHINNTIHIIIEDKISTSEHSNQLQRYVDNIKKECNNSTIYKIYFKMHEQGNYSQVESAGYTPYSRKKMLDILQKYIHKESAHNKNDIIIDFYNYINTLDQNINSYLIKPIKDWKRYSWQGFYVALQTEFKKSNWHHVPNQSGGFLGFFWNYQTTSIHDVEFTLYPQLEEDKLVIKLHIQAPTDKENRNKIRYTLQKLLLAKASKMNVSIEKYGRYGRTMSIARYKEIYRQTKKSNNNDTQIIDLQKTIEILHKVTGLVDQIRNDIVSSNINLNNPL